MSKEQSKKQGPLGPKERWSARRKREVVLRLLRGEPAEALSRELGVEIYRLEQWRERALLGIDEAMKDRKRPVKGVFRCGVRAWENRAIAVGRWQWPMEVG